MAIREIRIIGDEVLTKPCKPVTDMTKRNSVLIDDMIETMHKADGVGLAAPQVGVLKRIIVVDVEGKTEVLINPEIVEAKGGQTDDEACLSIPGKTGTVTRPNYVKVKALDRSMNEVVYEGEGLLARAYCHEIDHLDGRLYVSKVEGGLRDIAYDDEDAKPGKNKKRGRHR